MTAAAADRAHHRRFSGGDPDERDRAGTSLELLYDPDDRRRLRHGVEQRAGAWAPVSRARCRVTCLRGVPTRYEHAGGKAGLHRLEQAFYDSVLRDPLLQPLFGAGQPQHVDHLTMFTAESFGGPQCFSRELGVAHLIDVHRGLRITEAQRARFVELYMAALDAADMPDDEPFRTAVREHVEFGSRVAMQNSNATSDAELHPLREVPRWNWAGDDRRVGAGAGPRRSSRGPGRVA